MDATEWMVNIHHRCENVPHACSQMCLRVGLAWTDLLAAMSGSYCSKGTCIMVQHNKNRGKNDSSTWMEGTFQQSKPSWTDLPTKNQSDLITWQQKTVTWTEKPARVSTFLMTRMIKYPTITLTLVHILLSWCCDVSYCFPCCPSLLVSLVITPTSVRSSSHFCSHVVTQ